MARGAFGRPTSHGRLPVRYGAALRDEEPVMSAIFRIAILAAVVVAAGCERRSEEVVLVPPPQVEPEPVYNKF